MLRSIKNQDLLLLAAKLIVGLLMGFIIFALVMVLLSFGAVLTVGQGEILAKLAMIDAPRWIAWVVALALALVTIALFLGVRFTLELYGIIASVGDGDPFQPENGARLGRMGWLALGAQAIGLAVSGIGAWLRPFAEKVGEDITFDFDLEFSGILLILILFILARVFRHDAAMREDLEGTM